LVKSNHINPISDPEITMFDGRISMLDGEKSKGFAGEIHVFNLL
jgi:hypothetical protein